MIWFFSSASRKIALDGDAVVAVGAHLRPEDLDPVGAAALGAVHGDLGLLVAGRVAPSRLPS